MSSDLTKTNSVISQAEFEIEFRRIYSDLYPTEESLSKAIDYYKDQPIEFTDVDKDPKPRIEFALWMMKDTTIEERIEKDHLYNCLSMYVFSDIKKIIGESKLDVAYLSPTIVTNPFSPSETKKINIGKCLTAIKKNNINIGAFSNVLWQGGTAYFDACIDDMIEEDDGFKSTLAKLSYQNPVLVISNLVDEGKMLGEYLNFLRSKSISIFSGKYPNIPGFYFTGKIYSRSFNYTLDELNIL